MSKALSVIGVSVLLGSGIGYAGTRATITARPGDSIIVPSRHVVCGVDSNPRGVLCALYGAKLHGYYMVFISRSKVTVVLDKKPMRIVYSARQPK